jgi:hypothetical protein
MKAAFIVSMLAALLSGCGQLAVRVDVLDPEHVRQESTEEGWRKLYGEIVRSQNGEFAARVDRNFASYQREVIKLAKSYDEVAKKLQDSRGNALKEVADGLRQGVTTGVVLNDVSRHGSTMEELAQGIRELGVKLKWSGVGVVPAEMRDRLANFKAEDKKLQLLQFRELRALLNDGRKVSALVSNPQPVAAGSPPAVVAAAAAAANSGEAAAPEVKAAADQAAVVASIAQRSIIQDGSLAATEYAYLVAQAPERLWANNFNRAFASGNFGNVDVVIRLNSTADFSVKGLLFDATKVAQVASKVLTQSILIGAQMAGVPTATATTGTQTGGDALSKSSADLATADAAIAKRQALAESQRGAARAMARTILGSALSLESTAMAGKGKDDPERSPVHKAINDSLAALKPLLSMQDLQ